VENTLSVPHDEQVWSAASSPATGSESPGIGDSEQPYPVTLRGGGGPGTKAPALARGSQGLWEMMRTAGGTVGIGRRIAELYEVRVNALLDRAEDPRQVLDYSYARQQDLLLRIRRAIIDVAAARSRAAVQESQLRNSADRLRQQAQQSVVADREELARKALALRTATLAQADDLAAEQTALRADEERLSAAVHRLQQKVEAFRVHKETLKARYTASQAAESVGLILGGISEEEGDVDLATHRAEDTTARLQARANALDELLATGNPADVTGLAGDQEIQAQLDAVTTQAAVQEELAAIKDQLAAETSQPPDGPASSRR
jgi:phage shock protein A